MTSRTRGIGRIAISAFALSQIASTSLQAQFPLTVQPVRCGGRVPAPFSSVRPARAVVRMMAEGAFPEADAAAARALLVLIRDILGERAPVTVLSTVDILNKISSSLPAASDTRGLAPGTRLLTTVVQRSGDSVVAVTTVRVAGRRNRPAPPGKRLAARADDIMRLGLAIAAVAAREGADFNESMGTSPPPLGSTSAGDAYIYGLAEASGTTPVALARAKQALIRASDEAPALSDVWRWRARVERSLIEWSRETDSDDRADLRADLLGSSTRAAQLAPRSQDAQLLLADAHLIGGDIAKAEALVSAVASTEGESPGVARRRAVLSRIRGDDARAQQLLVGALLLAPRDPGLLVDLASVALTRGDRNLACHALNAAIAVDETMAPAYALRALVRGDLRDRRASWIDAEIATRLGHPEWGERAAAVLDVKYGDATQAVARLKPLGGTSAHPTNYFDAFLLSRAAVTMSRSRSAVLRVLPWLCKEYWWSFLVRDAQAVGATVGSVCPA